MESFKVHVLVNDGVAFLWGKVDLCVVRPAAAKCAFDAGATAVDNALRVPGEFCY